MDTTSSLVQTVAVLSACIVFLAKQTVDAYRNHVASKNSFVGDVVASQRPDSNGYKLLKELHNWHKPSPDPQTGQPRFLWYDDKSEVLKELKKLNLTLASLVDELRKVREVK